MWKWVKATELIRGLVLQPLLQRTSSKGRVALFCRDGDDRFDRYPSEQGLEGPMVPCRRKCHDAHVAVRHECPGDWRVAKRYNARRGRIELIYLGG